MSPAGRPPVTASLAVAPSEERLSKAAQNYLTVVNTIKAGRGEDVRAIRAMFGGDKSLMDRFLAVAFASLQGNGDLLMNADPLSIVQAIKDAASLGLEPTGLTGEGAIVRYGTTAKFMPMWRGYLRRIRNSGKVLEIDCQIVYLNDEFSLTLGTDPSIHHVPKIYGEKNEEDGSYIEERGGYRGAYAWALMPSGIRIIEYLPVDDINDIRDRYAESWKNENKRASSPWTTAYVQMARKTVIRRLAQRLPGEAVDHLLRIDALADNAASEAKAAASDATAVVSEVRRLALAAASGKPEERPEAPAIEATVEAATEPEPEATDESLCAVVSPYGDGQTCVRKKDHAEKNHQGGDGSTWA